MHAVALSIFFLASTLAFICFVAAAVMSLYALGISFADWLKVGSARPINWLFPIAVAGLGLIWTAIAYGLHFL